MSGPIAIDARLNAYRQGGIARSTALLIEHLVELEPNEDWMILMHRRMQQWPAVTTARSVRLWTPPHHRWEQWSLPLELWRVRPRLLHCPDFIPPLRRPCPAVITVHDLAFKLFPEILDDAAKRFYGQIEQAVGSAEAIIADSYSTANDITRLLGVPAERIDVIHCGVALEPLEVAEGEQRVIRGVQLSAGSFIVFVSTFEPRKNIPSLLRAFKQLCKRQAREPYQLVLAGSRGWLDEPIFQTLKELDLGERVQIVEQPSDAEIHWLLSACRVYVNPSRYEGFGLAALEALACGAPAIVSNTSSLPEVVGAAAMLVDPMDLAGWTEAMERLWADEQQRGALRQAGLARAAVFTWERTAAQTLAVYRRVLGAATR